jgi:hypothetical protein
MTTLGTTTLSELYVTVFLGFFKVIVPFIVFVVLPVALILLFRRK